MRTLSIALTLALLTPRAVLAEASPTAAPSAAPSAAGSPAAVPKADVTVHIHDSAFRPQRLTIHVGQSVEFVNDDEIEHDATAADGTFASPELDQGQSFTFTFTKAATITYGCNDHAFMHGTIVVVPATSG